MPKLFAKAIVPIAAIVLGGGHPCWGSPAKPAPGPGDFLYGIASGPTGSLDFSIAGRLASLAALDQEGGPHGESGPRLVPVVEPSAQQALADLLTQPSTDLAILPVPLLDRAARADNSLKRRLAYVAPLQLETVHLVARSDVGSVGDLADRFVAVDGPGGVGSILLADLGVAAKLVETLPVDPVAALRDHSIDAVIMVGDDPASGLAKVPSNAGLKLLPIAYSPALAADFVPGSVRHEDMPGLVVKQGVETVAVPAVLAVYLRPSYGERARTLWSLLAGVLDHVAEQGTDPAGRALGDVNWAAEMSGWQRLPAMTRWLNARRAGGGSSAGDRKDH